MLSMRSLHSATVLPSNSYYTVVASIFLVSAASCKAICRVASVRTSYYSQPFWLKVSWERGEVLGVSPTRAMARVGLGLAPPMMIVTYFLLGAKHEQSDIGNPIPAPRIIKRVPLIPGGHFISPKVPHYCIFLNPGQILPVMGITPHFI